MHWYQLFILPGIACYFHANSPFKAGDNKYDTERARPQSMEKTKSHPKLVQISKKRKAATTEGLAPNVNESSTSSSESEEADSSISGNVESRSNLIRKIQTSSAGERNPYLGVHRSPELPKAPSAPQQPHDGKQCESDLKREKKRKKNSERLQVPQGQIHEGLFHDTTVVEDLLIGYRRGTARQVRQSLETAQ